MKDEYAPANKWEPEDDDFINDFDDLDDFDPIYCNVCEWEVENDKCGCDYL